MYSVRIDRRAGCGCAAFRCPTVLKDKTVCARGAHGAQSRRVCSHVHLVYTVKLLLYTRCPPPPRARARACGVMCVVCEN